MEIAAQSEASGGTELAAEETAGKGGGAPANEAAGETSWTAPEKEIEPGVEQEVPFTASA
jgi:hypothetical protein